MFRKITLTSILLVLIVIILGAYVRLSDAGLGCPDWPGCYGSAIVSDDPAYIAQANEAYPDNLLDIAKAWKEMIHRYVAGALGILMLLLALCSWTVKGYRGTAIWGSLGLLMLVIFQAALGMWTVTLKVMPIIVTSHLLMGMMTCWLLYRLYIQVNPDIRLREQLKGPRRFAQFCMLVLFVQIFLGGWTSTNFASLACSGYPECSGTWRPNADFRGALNILGGLMTGDASPLAFPAKVAAHWMHRIGALVTFLSLGILSVLASSGKNDKSVRRAGSYLSGLLLVQICLGIANVTMALPMWAAISHNGVAALLMLVLIRISFYAKYTLPSDALARKRSPAEPTEAVLKRTAFEIEPVIETPAEAPITVAQPVAVEAYLESEPETLYLRLKTQLQRTRSGLGGILGVLIPGTKIDEDLLEELETSLIMADVGIDTTIEIMAQLSSTVKEQNISDGEGFLLALQDQLNKILEPCNKPLDIPEQEGPFVILVVGVNGVGKTTTIGKLAKRLQAQGKSIMLAAGDTFRAAAIEQLQTWGERNNIHVVAQHTGADSASVIYDGVQSAQAKNIDVLIADTAGRLHSKSHLMNELIKIKRIMGKLDATAPHEVLLVLDAGTGQNALSQGKVFNEAVSLTGLALTKLDGTAKGGVIFALAKQLQLPIRYIGVGEGIDDLQEFNAKNYVQALFVKEN